MRQCDAPIRITFVFRNFNILTELVTCVIAQAIARPFSLFFLSVNRKKKGGCVCHGDLGHCVPRLVKRVLDLCSCMQARIDRRIKVLKSW